MFLGLNKYNLKFDKAQLQYNKVWKQDNLKKIKHENYRSVSNWKLVSSTHKYDAKNKEACH